MNREDFKMLNQDIVYFDNVSTNFKQAFLCEKISEYYNNYCENAHRG